MDECDGGSSPAVPQHVQLVSAMQLGPVGWLMLGCWVGMGECGAVSELGCATRKMQEHVSERCEERLVMVGAIRNAELLDRCRCVVAVWDALCDALCDVEY